MRLASGLYCVAHSLGPEAWRNPSRLLHVHSQIKADRKQASISLSPRVHRRNGERRGGGGGGGVCYCESACFFGSSGDPVDREGSRAKCRPYLANGSGKHVQLWKSYDDCSLLLLHLPFGDHYHLVEYSVISGVSI